MRRRFGAVIAALALTACSSTSGAGEAAPTRLAIREASVASPLPDVVVRHLQTHSWVQLKNALPATKPVLVWFWAPH